MKFKRIFALLLAIIFTATTMFSEYDAVFAKENVSYDKQTNLSDVGQYTDQNKSLNETASSMEDKGTTVDKKSDLNVKNSSEGKSVLNEVYQSKSQDFTSTVEKDKKERQILIKYTDSDNADTVKSAVKNEITVTKFEVKESYKKQRMETVQVGDSDDIDGIIKELRKNKNVLYAQRNQKLYINDIPQDAMLSNEWGLINNGQSVSGQAGVADIDINALDAWNITEGSSDVVVGVLDTGIDINHQDLKDRIYTNTKEVSGDSLDNDGNGYIDDVNGYDFYNNDSNIYDDSANDTHGTHVAGIIVASANNDGIVGVAPKVKILPLKFINGNYGYTSDAIKAIEYAKAMGVKVINCSWGGTENNPALYNEMQDSGILFVCAAGNNGSDVAVSPVYPACFDLPNIISVAAIDNKGNLASFSNYGNGVDIAAPGVSILSTLPNNSYGYMSGTSMATPHVSGVAALMLSNSIGATATEMKAKIEGNTTNITQLQGKVASGGLVNAYKALTGAGTVIISNPTQPSTPSNSNDRVDVYPFTFISTIENGRSAATKFVLADSAMPCQKVQLIMNERDKKDATYNGYIDSSQKELSLGNLTGDTEYNFNVKIIKTDSIDSYVGSMVLNLQSDPVTNAPISVHPAITVYKNPINYTYAAARAVSMNAPNAQSVTMSVYNQVYGNSIPSNFIMSNNYETEDNTYFSEADLIIDDDQNFGTIGWAGDVDYYKVMFSSDGDANFWLSWVPEDRNYDIEVYDDNFNLMGKSSILGNADEIVTGRVQSGHYYYIKVYGHNDCFNESSCYWLRAKNYAASSSGDQYETNNTYLQAKPSTNCNFLYANIHESSDVDYYSFTVDVRAKLAVTLSNIPSETDYNLIIFNISLSTFYSSTNSGTTNESISCILEPGTYYMEIYPFKGYSNNNYKLEYTCTEALNPPSVTLTAPVNGSSYTLGQSVTISASGNNCDHIGAFVKGPNDASHSWVADNTDGINGSGNNFSYSFTPKLAGNYGIFVRGRNGKDGDPNTDTVDSDIVTINVSNSQTTCTSITNSGSVTNKSTFAFYANNVQNNTSGISFVQYAIWRVADGVNTAKWYKGSYDSANNRWVKSIDISTDFEGKDGEYGANIYGWNNAGNVTLLGYTSVKVDRQGPSCSSITNSGTNKSSTFSIYANNVTDEYSGVSLVQYAIWRVADGVNTAKWYNGSYDISYNRWVKSINITTDFEDQSGEYGANVFGWDNLGNVRLLGYTSVIVDRQGPSCSSISNSGNSTSPIFNIYANNVTDDYAGVSLAQYAVWRAADGVNTAKWYNGSYDSANNRWVESIDITTDFENGDGEYTANVFGWDNVGNVSLLGQTSFIYTPIDDSLLLKNGLTALKIDPTYGFYIDGQYYTYIDLIENRPVLIRNYYGLKIALLRYIFDALGAYMKVAHEDSDSYYDLRMQAAQRAFSDKVGIGDANGMNSETWAYLKKVIEDYGVDPSTFDREDFYSRFDYQVKKLYLESIDLYNSNCDVASLVSTMQLKPTINEYSSSADINSLQMLLRGFGLFINFESYSDVQTLCAVQALEEKMGTSSDYEFDYQDWNTLSDFFELHYENLTSDEKNSICNDLYNRQQELMQQYIEDRLVVTPTAEVGADGAVTITADNSYADFIDIKVYSGSDIVWGASTDSVATVASEVYKVNTTENTQSTVLNVVYNLDSSGQTPLKALKEIYSVRLYNTSESQISVSSAVYGQNGVVGSLASYRSIDLTLDPGTYIICATATKTINGSRWSSSESASLYYSKENWSSEFTIQGTSNPDFTDTEAPTWESGSVILVPSVSTSSVTLYWPYADDDFGVSQYVIYKDNVVIATVSSDIHTYTISGLYFYNWYTFKVEAEDDAGHISNNGPSTTVYTENIIYNDFLTVDEDVHLSPEEKARITQQREFQNELLSNYVGSFTWLDALQLGLDLLGMVPVIGEPVDGVNACIYMARGDDVNAALSAASMLPIVGWVSTGGKLSGKSIKALGKIARTEKVVNALTGFSSRYLKYGEHTFLIEKNGMMHFLQRHHPDFWDGSIKSTQTFFDKNMTIDDVENAIEQVMQQNRDNLISQGTAGVSSITGVVNGKTYVLTFDKGRACQFYPKP